MCQALFWDLGHSQEQTKTDLVHPGGPPVLTEGQAREKMDGMSSDSDETMTKLKWCPGERSLGPLHMGWTARASKEKGFWVGGMARAPEKAQHSACMVGAQQC